MSFRQTKLYSVFAMKCPRCHTGPLFEHSNPYNFNKLLAMPKNCPVCGQEYFLEPGFYFGAMYVSYGINVGVILPAAAVVYYTMDWGFAAILISLILLQLAIMPLVFRISRALYINLFVHYRPEADPHVQE